MGVWVVHIISMNRNIRTIPLSTNSLFIKSFVNSVCTSLSKSLGKLNKISFANLGLFVSHYAFSTLSTSFHKRRLSLVHSGAF